MAVDAERATIADDLDDVDVRGSGREEALDVHARLGGEPHQRAVLLALFGARGRVEHLEVRFEQPAQEVEVMRAEVEEHSSSG